MCYHKDADDLEFLDSGGASPFAAWFDSLDAVAAEVTTAVRRLELGNLSKVKGLGGGVFEYKKRKSQEK